MEDLIKREDAIKGKRAETLDANADFMMGRSKEKYRILSIGFAEGWNAHIEYCKDITSAEKQGEWIPCSERLPSEYSDEGRVLVTTDVDVDGLGVIIMPICDVNSWYRKRYISAWMPLPIPYKEGADNETD